MIQYQTSIGGFVSIGFQVYTIYLLGELLVPTILGEVFKSNTVVLPINATTTVFDPYNYGFDFSVGISPPLIPGIGSFSMQYFQ